MTQDDGRAAQLARPADDTRLDGRVEVALGDRRGIERAEERADGARPHGNLHRVARSLRRRVVPSIDLIKDCNRIWDVIP